MRMVKSQVRLILAVVLAIFVNGIVLATLGTILPTFPLSMQEKGHVALAQAVGLMAASVGAGPLVDIKGKKAGLLTGLALIAGAQFALPSLSASGVVSVVMLVLGLGSGALVTAANALVSDIHPARRAVALNLLTVSYGLGGLATPFFAANVLGGSAVRLCYTAAALTAATLLLNAATSMPPPAGRRAFRLSEAADLLRHPLLYLLSAFLFLYMACEIGLWNWLASHLIGRGIPQNQALNILSLGFALGLLTGRVAVARILMRVLPPTVTMAAAAFTAVLVYALLGASGVNAAWLLTFATGLAMAPIFPTSVAMVGDCFPRMTATAMGLVMTAGWAGLAFSSPLIGGIAQRAPGGLETALLVIPAFALLMALVNLVMRPMVLRATALAKAAAA